MNIHGDGTEIRVHRARPLPNAPESRRDGLLRTLSRRRGWIIAATMLALAAAVAYEVLTVPRYTAAVRILYDPASQHADDARGSVDSATDDPERRPVSRSILRHRAAAIRDPGGATRFRTITDLRVGRRRVRHGPQTRSPDLLRGQAVAREGSPAACRPSPRAMHPVSRWSTALRGDSKWSCPCVVTGH